MKTFSFVVAAVFAGLSAFGATVVSIVGEDFHINGQPTYKGRMWKGHRIEGLLMNSRMVQGIFDDANPETISKWAYSDTGKWDPDRNTAEFIAAMPEWKRHGMISFTINFQGGSPEGYSRSQPWDNNAFAEDGSIKPAYAARMKRILDAADRLGMIPIVGYFYLGASPRLKTDETAIKATEHATRFLFEGSWRNILVEINNETNPTYQPPVLRPERVHTLIEKVKNMRRADGSRLLVGTSYGGGAIPTTNAPAPDSMASQPKAFG